MLVFNPNNVYYHVFQAYIIILNVFSSVIYINFAAFRKDIEGDDAVSMYDEQYIPSLNRL